MNTYHCAIDAFSSSLGLARFGSQPEDQTEAMMSLFTQFAMDPPDTDWKAAIENFAQTQPTITCEVAEIGQRDDMVINGRRLVRKRLNKLPLRPA